MSWQVTKKILLVLILVGLTVGTMRLTAIDRNMAPNPFWVWARDTAAPLQQGIWRTAQVVDAGAAFVFSWGRDTSYSRALEKKIADLEGQIRSLRAVEQENKRLRALLAYQETHDKSGIVAAVIGRDPDNWFSTVIINRGKAHGVARGAVVVTPAGLIGRVLEVSDNTAEVLLITDPRSAVGSTVYETQVPGIVRGALDTTGRLRMQYVVKDEPVRKGFVVLTSNLSGVFPPGIPVGTVTGVEEEESGLFKTVYLKPAVDLNRLDEVLVLRKQ
ncbi:MAG: rod shape-determining protein MreC [Bacillota bacterium]